MKAIERLYQYLNCKNLKPTALEKEIGLSNGYIGVQKKRNSDMGEGIILKIIDYCRDLNPIWLLTGEGSMFRGEEATSSLPISEKKRHLIPLFDITAIGGRQYDADMTAVSSPSEMIDTGDWFQDATAAMRVQGDSMSPEYKSGSIVALRQINDPRIIMYGEDYVVETEELRVIKRLQRSDDPTCLMACSVNQEQWESGPLKGHLIHEPFEIPKDSIRRIFLVLGEVRRNHSCNIIDVVK